MRILKSYAHPAMVRRAAAGVFACGLALGIVAPAALASFVPNHHEGGMSTGVAISGTVKSLGNGSIVVQDNEGFWRTIVLSAATTYSEGPMNVAPAITVSNLAVGENITSIGTVDPNHTSLDATAIKINLDEVTGTVTSVTPTTLVVHVGHSSSTVTIGVSSVTVVFNHSGVVPISTVTVGSVVEGFGVIQSNGSLLAIYVGLATAHTGLDVAHLSGFKLPNCYFPHHYMGHNIRK